MGLSNARVGRSIRWALAIKKADESRNEGVTVASLAGEGGCECGRVKMGGEADAGGGVLDVSGG